MTRQARRPEETTLSVWQVVELARHPDRPYSLDYIHRLAPDFIELHGDRLAADDPALVSDFLAPVDRLEGREKVVGEAFGAYGEKVRDPAEVPAALKRCVEAVRGGRAALLHARVTRI